MDVAIATIIGLHSAESISIGAVKFQGQSGGKVLQGSSFNEGLHFTNGGPVGEDAKQILQEFTAWGGDWNTVGCVWGRSSHMDLALLATIFTVNNMEPPWKSASSRCVDTLHSLVGSPEVDITGFDLGSARDVATIQAMTVQKAMALITTQ